MIQLGDLQTISRHPVFLILVLVVVLELGDKFLKPAMALEEFQSSWSESCSRRPP